MKTTIYEIMNQSNNINGLMSEIQFAIDHSEQFQPFRAKIYAVKLKEFIDGLLKTEVTIR